MAKKRRKVAEDRKGDRNESQTVLRACEVLKAFRNPGEELVAGRRGSSHSAPKDHCLPPAAHAHPWWSAGTLRRRDLSQSVRPSNRAAISHWLCRAGRL